MVHTGKLGHMHTGKLGHTWNLCHTCKLGHTSKSCGQVFKNFDPDKGVLPKNQSKKGGLGKFQCKCRGTKIDIFSAYIHYIIMF